uniref:CCHC-type domain-containing protein n=1 Tax=Hordeum vulgare subsp. vulgare TaxID=112509 RepID=A0A8I6XZ41_HORVV
MALVLVDPVDRRTTLSDERVSYGDRWSSSESESSARSYRDVARTPPAVSASSAVAAPGRAAPVVRPPAKDCLRPRSEVHYVSGGPVLDADGFQQARRRERRRRPCWDAPAKPSPTRRCSPSPEELAGLCFRCLDHRHCVRDCPNDIRCRRCLASGHASRVSDGRWPAAATPRSPRTASAPQTRPLCGASARALPPAARPPAPVLSAPAPPPPRVRPTEDAPSRVFMAQTEEMDEAEQVLARAVVASVTGNRPSVSVDEVAVLLLGSLELEEGDFTVHQHHPEDFLIIFSSLAIMRRLRGEHFISSARFSLSLRPWCKLAHAGAGELEYRVELELRGIPAHAWLLSTAEHVLGDNCWIERLHPRTRSREDMAVFRVSGRAHDPAGIRRAAVLEIVEQLPGRVRSEVSSVRTLTFPVSIALTKAKLIRVAPAVAQAAGNGGEADDAGGRHGSGSGKGHGPGPGRTRRRGRKRRRTDEAQVGRVMA